VTTSHATVRNVTRSTVLGSKIREARSFLERGRGLMFVSKLESGEGMLIDPCSSIHTFWMRFPIDVLYVDRDGTVLRADRSMKPWRIGPVFTGSRWVVELPDGTIDATGTKAGDKLLVER
jgi:uncharacterized protein